MGLHRAVKSSFNPIEEEIRKRVFWCVRKLDTYVGALLGLPQMLSDDDIDQEQPIEVDDECITEDQILPMPVGRVSLMAGFNAHTRIVAILSKTVKYIYPIKGKKAGKSDSYIVSHAKIREIERDLQAWMENLPECFRPGGEVPHEFVRYVVQTLQYEVLLTWAAFNISCAWLMPTLRCFFTGLSFITYPRTYRRKASINDHMPALPHV